MISSRYGEFDAPAQGDLIGDALRLYGEWAHLEIEVLARFLRPGATVIDAGSFIGTHACAFASIIGPSGVVHAFEPNPAAFALLSANVARVSAAKIQPHAFGLGRRAGSARVDASASSNNLGASALLADADARGVDDAHDATEIAIRTLDEIGISTPIDFIKIDVEGAEQDVLAGAESTILRDAPTIFVEVNSIQASHEMVAWANSHGYASFGLITPAFNPANFRETAENVFGAASECGLLFVPRAKQDAHAAALADLCLPEIRTVDDLVLLLLHKPQYPYEVLAHGPAAARLGLRYPSPRAAELEAAEGELRRGLENQRERIVQLEAMLSELGAENARIRELQASMGDLSDPRHHGDAAHARDARIQELEAALRGRDHDHAALLASTSWKLTAPLRALGSLRQRSLPRAPRRGDSLTRPKATTVLLPVYRDTVLTRACIESALPGIQEVPGARLLVLNDHSPEPDMAAMLQHFAAENPERMAVVTNDANLGFVRTVNAGIRAAGESDLVLLNSDVILPPGWLRRLQDEAYSRPFVGTVTPLSNNTTICTFPEFLQDNPPPLGSDVRAIDATFQLARLDNVEAPTGVGFCMYIRNACRREVGFLDEERFGRGYGEENDFCQRAIRLGWCNLITPNLFAFHKGGVSFGDEKAALIENAMRTVNELHPGYAHRVHQFIQADPLKKARLLRLMSHVATASVARILHVGHGLGGGTDQHIVELADSLYRRGSAFSLILTPLAGAGDRYRLRFGYSDTADEVVVHLPQQMDTLVELLRAMGVSLVHYHHVLNLHGSVLELAVTLGIPYKLTVHDYYLLGGNPTLTNAEGVFVDDVDCTENPLYPLPAGTSLADWRNRYRDFIESARCVVFPSMAARDIFCRVYRPRIAIPAPHLEERRNVDSPPAVFRPSRRPFTVGVLGALSKEKGADYLEQLAHLANAGKLPLAFVLIGYAYRRLQNVTVTGPYNAEETADKLREEGCDLLLFPARWPETYSYTLSYGLESGLPIVAPRLGAFTERLAGRGHVMMFEHGASPEALLPALRQFVEDLARGAEASAPSLDRDERVRDYYAAAYLSDVDAAGIGQTTALHEARLAALDVLLSNGKVPPTTWPEAAFRALLRLHAVPGLWRLKQMLPPRLKASLKAFVARYAGG